LPALSSIWGQYAQLKTHRFRYQAVGSILGIGAASAADMAVKAPVYKALPVVDPWVGFYVGGSWGEWKFPWFGTVRLRAGYNPSTNWLFYVTGGLAFGESQYNFNFSQPGAANNFPPSPTTYALSQSQTSVGYAVGAGGEVKPNRNWSVKGEYLFVDLGRRTINTRDIDGFPFMVSYSVRDHIARIGLNYAFGQ